LVPAVTPQFACRVCGCPYPTEHEARRCEDQAVPTPKFDVGARVVYRTVAIEFPTRVRGRVLAFTRIGAQGLGTHMWFYTVDYPAMQPVITPEILLHPGRATARRPRPKTAKIAKRRARRLF
jgi:hypothetical protein